MGDAPDDIVNTMMKKHKLSTSSSTPTEISREPRNLVSNPKPPVEPWSYLANPKPPVEPWKAPPVNPPIEPW
ncbi:MAG: hypothetical protein RTV72_03105 [Candidatus Thorarchaeota archaeon]